VVIKEGLLELFCGLLGYLQRGYVHTCIQANFCESSPNKILIIMMMIIIIIIIIIVIMHAVGAQSGTQVGAARGR
jgi:hypothetical protein